MICAAVLIVNISGLSWIQEDRSNLIRASKRCGEKYEESPCLVRFIKYGERNYGAICGKPLKEMQDDLAPKKDGIN